MRNPPEKVGVFMLQNAGNRLTAALTYAIWDWSRTEGGKILFISEQLPCGTAFAIAYPEDLFRS